MISVIRQLREEQSRVDALRARVTPKKRRRRAAAMGTNVKPTDDTNGIVPFQNIIAPELQKRVEEAR